MSIIKYNSKSVSSDINELLETHGDLEVKKLIKLAVMSKFKYPTNQHMEEITQYVRDIIDELTESRGYIIPVGFSDSMTFSGHGLTHEIKLK